MREIPSASQTVGPFFAIGFDWLTTPTDGLATPTVRGHLQDGEGQPVSDAVLEIWGGARDEYVSFQRVATAEHGEFAWSFPPAERAEELPVYWSVMIFMRGLLKPLLTRVYLAESANEEKFAQDPVWSAVPAARRHTLLASAVTGFQQQYVWNLCLQDTAQGGRETVFFACSTAGA